MIAIKTIRVAIRTAGALNGHDHRLRIVFSIADEMDAPDELCEMVRDVLGVASTNLNTIVVPPGAKPIHFIWKTLSGHIYPRGVKLVEVRLVAEGDTEYRLLVSPASELP